MHGSDSAASADREAAFFFPALPPLGGAPQLRGDAAAAYVAAALQPALAKGLTALAKAKPSSKPVGAANRGPLVGTAKAHCRAGAQASAREARSPHAVQGVRSLPEH